MNKYIALRLAIGARRLTRFLLVLTSLLLCSAAWAVTTVNMTSPTNGSTVAAASVALTASVTPAAGKTITKVEFRYGSGNGILIGTVTTAPYTYTWTNVPAGVYDISAVAYDSTPDYVYSSAITVQIGSPLVVQLTSPANNAVYGANTNINIAGSATRDGVAAPITQMRFYKDNTLLGTVTSAPYTWTMNNVAPNSFTVTARAYEATGNYFDSASNQVTVADAPLINLSTPSNNANIQLPGTVNMSAVANPGGDGYATVAKVDFLINGSIVGTDTSSPYSFSWSPQLAGTYTYSARVTDTLGGTKTSGNRTINVLAGPMTVAVTSPANNASFQAPATIPLTAAVSGGAAVSSLSFYQGATLIGSGTSQGNNVFTYNWTGVAAGTYSVTAKATPVSGSVVTSPAITVTSQANAAPTVSLTTPSNGAAYTAPASIALTASAADTDGTVSQVQFYNGATLIGTGTLSSGNASSGAYVYNWSNVPAGSYSITARATDNTGAATTSSANSITVSTANVAPTVSLTAPNSGATYAAPASIALTANAADTDGTVSQVQFFSGASLIGTGTRNSGTASSGAYVYNWTNVPVGNYSITAKATDNSGAVSTSAASSITVNNGAPEVSVTSPANGAFYSTPADVVFNASATSQTGVTQLQFYADSTLLGSAVMVGGTATSGAYVYNWSNVSTGTYTVTARAIDGAGRLSISPPVRFTVRPNPAIYVGMTSPSANQVWPPATPTTPVHLLVNVGSLSSTVASVQFYEGATYIGAGTLASTDTGSANYAADWATASPGSHTVYARVADTAGNVTTSAPITFVVNTAPVISMSLPANGTSFPGPAASITLQAMATDANGVISGGNIGFYINGLYAMEGSNCCSGSPSLYGNGGTWNNVQPGTYTIEAVATDNNGTVTRSAPITVTVNPDLAPTVTILNPAGPGTYNIAQARGGIGLTAQAADPDGGVSKVSFYQNGKYIDNGYPYSPGQFSTTWFPTGPGTYILTAVATDNVGRSTTSAPVSIIVSPNVAPTVSAPILDYQSTPGVGPASMFAYSNVSDPDDGVVEVQYYLNGIFAGSAGFNGLGYPAWLKDYPNTVPPGSYQLTGVARDRSGAYTVSTPTSFTLSGTPSTNAPPTVSISAGTPSGNAPASLTLTATASDSDGSVAKVDFYLDGIYQGTSGAGTTTNGSTYTVTLAGLAAGSRSFTAVATDNAGAAAISAPVSVTIGANTAPVVTLASSALNVIAPAPLAFTFSASDDGSVSTVDIYMDGLYVTTRNPASGTSYSINNAPVGTHTVTAVATDNAGLTTTSSALTFTVTAPSNTPATMTWKAPANGTSFIAPATITPSIIVSDPDGIAGNRVAFYVNGTLAFYSSGQQGDGSFAQNWTNVQVGSYTLTAVVTDNQGVQTVSSPITVSVVANTPPTIRWKSPANGFNAPLATAITFAVYADDADNGVADNNVRFYLNGNFLLNSIGYGRQPDGSYYTVYTPTTPGTYVMTAAVTDNAGISTTSAPLTFTVTGRNPPTVSLTSPANGTAFTAPASIALAASASAAAGNLSSVRFFNGETLIATATQSTGTATSGAYVANWSNVSPGTYAITAQASDSYGTTVSSTPVTVTVGNNPAATVNFLSPVPNSVYTAPATVPLSVAVSSGAAVVNQVQFFSGATLIGTGTLASGTGSNGTWTASWSNVAAGSYAITAKATDVNSAVTTSVVLPMTVNPAQSGQGGMFFVSTDHLGTPRLIQNMGQQAVWKWEQEEAFGDSVPNENPIGLGNFQFNQRFPGQYADAETGASYNYHRSFDAKTGRYLESDPIGLGGGINTYLYAGANALSNIDPTGEFLVVPLWAWIIGGGTFATGGEILAGGAAVVGTAVVVGSASSAPSPSIYTTPAPGGGSGICDPECDRLWAEMQKKMETLRGRYYDMLWDKCNQWNNARLAPNPNATGACAGTSWAGHQHAYSGWQAGLRNLIAKALKRGCPIPPGAWQWAYTMQTPQKPAPHAVPQRYRPD